MAAPNFSPKAPVMAVLGVGLKELFIAGGVEGGKQSNGPGNLGEGKNHFIDGGERLRRLSGLNHLRIFSRRREGSGIC